MIRTMQLGILRTSLGLAVICGSVIVLVFSLSPQSARAANAVTFELGNSLIDTTNYNGLAPYYWFANFGNASSTSGQPMNLNEAKNLPSWIHLDSNPACVGTADNCSTPDNTYRTGFSFVENTTADPPGPPPYPNAGGTSTGGFSTLTLPNGSTGTSGQAVDTVTAQAGQSTHLLYLHILPGAPSALRIWVVTDNGTQAGNAAYQEQARQRVSFRHNDDAANSFPDSSDAEQVDAEATNGGRIGQFAEGHNGIADAWSFLFTDVNANDFITIRPTAAGGGVTGFPQNRPAFAGIMIQAVPEPSSVMLMMLGVLSYACTTAHRRRR